MSKHLTFTVTLRKVTTGYKVTQFLCDDMSHGYSMAAVLIKSPEYGRCYAVGVDWQGNQVFTVNPAEQCAPPPVPMPQQFAPQPQQPQAYYPQPQPYPLPYPRQPQHPQFDAYAPNPVPQLGSSRR